MINEKSKKSNIKQKIMIEKRKLQELKQYFIEYNKEKLNLKKQYLLLEKQRKSFLQQIKKAKTADSMIAANSNLWLILKQLQSLSIQIQDLIKKQDNCISLQNNIQKVISKLQTK